MLQSLVPGTLSQLIGLRALSGRARLQLKPVGNLHSQPGVLKDLAAAVHDILHGLVDLHIQYYIHRDLRWENCIKVNVQGEWKGVIIDLEAAGCDREEWKGDGLRASDERMLEDCNGKKIYTNGIGHVPTWEAYSGVLGYEYYMW